MLDRLQHHAGSFEGYTELRWLTNHAQGRAPHIAAKRVTHGYWRSRSARSASVKRAA
jgi:hypothetical protein